MPRMATWPSKNHHWKDIEKIIRPGRLAIIIVPHAFGKLGAKLRISEVRLLLDVHSFPIMCLKWLAYKEIS